MKRVLITILLTLSIFTFAELSAQTIKGKVTDAVNSEPLVGATIRIEGTNLGAVAEVDGTYEIDNISAGIYSLKVSYIGYNDKIITGVEVKGKDVVNLSITLTVDGLTTEEIVIEANTTLANEQAMLVEQKNSDKVQDGISEQQIKRAPDAAASDVLKRIIGVNIVNDKYVYIRGTSDRYSLTTLNGVQLPSTETEKKSFSFDLFPSNLLENIIVSKSYTPDQPGNFSGGLVQISTKDFPDQFSLNYNMGMGLTDNTTNQNFLTYNSGQHKFLFFNTGLDDGGRQLPSQFPENRLINTTYTAEQLSDYSKLFRNNWAQTNRQAPLNANMQIAVGNNFDVGNNPLGFYAAYSYRTGFLNQDVSRALYNNDLTTLESFDGRNSEFSVLNGGILNLSYKLGSNNKVGLKTTYTINSEDVTTFLEGSKILTSEDNKDFRLYQTKFSERQLFSSILSGDHFIEKLGKLSVKWNASYNVGKKSEPDVKTMTYERLSGTEDEYNARMGSVADSDGGGRLFMELKDILRNASMDFSLPFLKVMGQQSKLKFGLYGASTSRNFDARNFAPKLNGFYTYIPYLSLDQIFAENNIGPDRINYEELTRESDKYSAGEENFAGYLMVDVPMNKLRVIGGLRYEYNRQQVSTLGRINEPIKADLLNRDILPSLNVVYSLTENMNIRGSASQTLSRPELREIAPFGYVDYITGLKTSGNPNIQRSLVNNYDVRYEYYPNAGEIFSASLFYKSYSSPIEEIYSPGQNNPEKTFDNAKGGAYNYGIELEVRKKLGFINKIFTDFTINANISLIQSAVNLENLQTVSTEKTRRMQGQSPYTINLGLFYDNYELGTSVNLLYNKFGSRISEVGNNGFNDIYEDGNDVIDFSVSKRLFERFEVKFSVKDLLNQEKIYTQEISGIEKIVRKYESGTRFALTLGYKL
ncbi:MAG: TonB-dependent receptor [Candidatus Kapaibacterium sp.]